MPRPRKHIPSLGLHKASGRAYVTDPFTRREHYFRHPYGSPECDAEYEDWVRKLLDRRKQVASGAPPGSSISVARLILDYLEHARGYYLKSGRPTSEIAALESALAPVNELHGTLAADAFGPADLKAVRQRMIAMEWARGNINKQVQRIRRVWRWGVEHGLVKVETLAALQAVPGLRRGRTAASETRPIEPVDLDLVERTLPRLRASVRAMVRIQLAADMRPGEVVIMRPRDIDQTQTPWLYTPHTHKTEHHGRERRIWLGPKARAVLTPLLARCRKPDTWLFPSRARGKHAARRTHWTVSGYRIAIQRACAQEPTIPAWHPNQLRHTQATAIRAAFGVEGAQAVLGHANLNTSEIYAEKNELLAKQIAEKLG